MRKRRFWWVVLLTVLVGLAGLGFYISEASTRVIFGLRDDFRHAVSYQEVPAGILGIRAQDCGACHQEIYEEWKTSYHAQAYVDPFFQAYWKKDENIWICLNCHTPLENQQPWIVHGLEDENIKKPIKLFLRENRPEGQFVDRDGKSVLNCRGDVDHVGFEGGQERKHCQSGSRGRKP